MFKLEIETTSAAFDDYPLDEIVRALSSASRRLLVGVDHGSLFDSNGNKVGYFEFTPEDY